MHSSETWWEQSKKAPRKWKIPKEREAYINEIANIMKGRSSPLGTETEDPESSTRKGSEEGTFYSFQDGSAQGSGSLLQDKMLSVRNPPSRLPTVGGIEKVESRYFPEVTITRDPSIHLPAATSSSSSSSESPSTPCMVSVLKSGSRPVAELLPPSPEASPSVEFNFPFVPDVLSQSVNPERMSISLPPRSVSGNSVQSSAGPGATLRVINSLEELKRSESANSVPSPAGAPQSRSSRTSLGSNKDHFSTSSSSRKVSKHRSSIKSSSSLSSNNSSQVKRPSNRSQRSSERGITPTEYIANQLLRITPTVDVACGDDEISDPPDEMSEPSEFGFVNNINPNLQKRLSPRAPVVIRPLPPSSSSFDQLAGAPIFEKQKPPRKGPQCIDSPMVSPDRGDCFDYLQCCQSISPPAITKKLKPPAAVDSKVISPDRTAINYNTLSAEVLKQQLLQEAAEAEAIKRSNLKEEGVQVDSVTEQILAERNEKENLKDALQKQMEEQKREKIEMSLQLEQLKTANAIAQDHHEKELQRASQQREEDELNKSINIAHVNREILEKALSRSKRSQLTISKRAKSAPNPGLLLSPPPADSPRERLSSHHPSKVEQLKNKYIAMQAKRRSSTGGSSLPRRVTGSGQLVPEKRSLSGPLKQQKAVEKLPRFVDPLVSSHTNFGRYEQPVFGTNNNSHIEQQPKPNKRAPWRDVQLPHEQQLNNSSSLFNLTAGTMNRTVGSLADSFNYSAPVDHSKFTRNQSTTVTEPLNNYNTLTGGRISPPRNINRKSLYNFQDATVRRNYKNNEPDRPMTGNVNHGNMIRSNYPLNQTPDYSTQIPHTVGADVSYNNNTSFISNLSEYPSRQDGWVLKSAPPDQQAVAVYHIREMQRKNKERAPLSVVPTNIPVKNRKVPALQTKRVVFTDADGDIIEFHKSRDNRSLSVSVNGSLLCNPKRLSASSTEPLIDLDNGSALCPLPLDAAHIVSDIARLADETSVIHNLYHWKAPMSERWL